MTAFPIVSAVAKHWWAFLVRGILAVLFAGVALAFPKLTLVALVLLFGVYAFADGLTALWIGGRARSWWFMLLGALGIVVGIYTFIHPAIAAIALLYVIAVWAIVRGVLEISMAIQFHGEISYEWALVLGGAVSVIFGVVLSVWPAVSSLALIWAIGAYTLALGLVMIVFALRLRGAPKRLEKLWNQTK